MDSITDNQITQQTHTCLKCKKPFVYRLSANAYHVVCPNCTALYSGFSGTLLLLKDFGVKTDKPSHIPLGSIGVLKDIKYQVIGFTVKKENGTKYFWQEYTLFNPIHGYASLTEYNGHWVYILSIDSVPSKVTPSNTIYYNDNAYALYARYTAITKYAVGEFPYNLNASSEAYVEEYISPPYLLTSEKTDDDLVWYLGESIDSSDIKSAFKLESIPETIGIGAVQPFVKKFSPQGLTYLIKIILLVFAGLQLFFFFNAKEDIVFNRSYFIWDSMTKKEIFTPTFPLKYGTKNVEVKLAANVDNSWMYAGVTLVNDKTGESYEVDIDAEYYHGVQDGESWSEGKGWNSKVVSSVPEGTYYLIIYPDKPFGVGTNIDVTVTRDVAVTSNMFVSWAILALFPIIYFFRRSAFERNRWSNSDFSPYQYDDE
jgi:hypothetical protein